MIKLIRASKCVGGVNPLLAAGQHLKNHLTDTVTCVTLGKDRMNTRLMRTRVDDIAFIDKECSLRMKRDGKNWTRSNTLHDIIETYKIVQESVDAAFDALLRQTVSNFIKEVTDSKDDIDPVTLQQINDLFAKYEQVDEFEEQEAKLLVTGPDHVM